MSKTTSPISIDPPAFRQPPKYFTIFTIISGGQVKEDYYSSPQRVQYESMTHIQPTLKTLSSISQAKLAENQLTSSQKIKQSIIEWQAYLKKSKLKSQGDYRYAYLIQIQNMEQPKILVAIRKRPLSKKQASRNESDVVSVKNGDTVIVSEYKQKVDLTKFLEETIFNFDFAFNQQTSNEQIYDFAVRPLVDSAFQGAKVTCFAYGQTGSGKTHTMNGNMGQGVRGLYTLGANDIFDYLASPQFRHLKAKLSFYEIYCGKLFDLLNKRAELKLREDNKNNINIIGLEEANVSSSEEFIDYLSLGSQQRVTSQNSANADSSRSHAILQISIKDGKKLHGKISFIDLAGNQRGADHMDMDKQTRIDGAQINKSLLSLKECIRALDQGKGHTPFRGSKLTMVLKDSFVGFCRTVMIGNVSPSSASSQNTLNTLRYADRVKQLRKPQQGGGNKEDLKAKQLMLPRQNKNAIRIMINNDDDAEDIARKRDQAQKQYGITEEVPIKKIPIQKQEVNVRKNSFGGKAINQIGVKPEKSNSVSKNMVGNSVGSKAPLNNNLIGPPPNLMNNKGAYGGLNKQKMENSFQPNKFQLNRYQNNSNQGVGKQRQQPMEIESPASSPYYMPNKGAPNINPKQFNQQNRPFQQPTSNNYSGMMHHSQNISNNFSQLSINSSTNPSQMNNHSQYGYPNNNQGQYPHGFSPNNNNFFNNYQNQNNNNYPNNFQQNFQNNGNFQQGNNHFQNNNNFQNNMNIISARGQQMQPPQPPQQQSYEIPESWPEMVNLISNSQDGHLNEMVLQQMNKQLFNEENELVSNHSETLRREIDMIKSEMGLLNEMEVDKSRISSRGYVRFMQESIEEKISLLEMLRERMINFTYKLDEMEEIQGGLGRTGNIDDEQLLDDIN